jgi:predicted transcriptional regulator of viral defense system
MNPTIASAADFVLDLASRGRHHFTTEEARGALGVSLPAIRASLRRLKRRGDIADPYRGFHVIVPPEYRRLGCLPPEQFVQDLAAHLGEPAYAALLSAAELHGAAHQRPQRFQVMLRKNRRPIRCGSVEVEFVARADLERTPVVEMNTPRGRLRVASPEATALELVGYADHCGGLSNVATVLGELAERLDAGRLKAAAALAPVAWSQRLGYLLERLQLDALALALEEHVRGHAKTVAPLVRSKPVTGAPRVARWRLAANESVEPDA